MERNSSLKLLQQEKSISAWPFIDLPLVSGLDKYLGAAAADDRTIQMPRTKPYMPDPNASSTAAQPLESSSNTVKSSKCPPLERSGINTD